MLRGSCLCGGVKYEIAGELGPLEQLLLQLVPEDVWFGVCQRCVDSSHRFSFYSRTGVAQGVAVVRGQSPGILQRPLWHTFREAQR